MTPTASPILYDRCRARVQELVDTRTEMADVERAIEVYPLDSDERAALWLWASGRRARRGGDASDPVVVGRTWPRT